MYKLPLYPDPRAVVERTPAIKDRDENCSLCKLHTSARTVCMPAEAANAAHGVTGGVLVLGATPTQYEDAAGRPLSGGSYTAFRKAIEKAGVPVVYANAVRCAPNGESVTATVIKACRGYTRGLIEEVKPSRIICLGKEAYSMVLDVEKDPITLGRRGYGYLSNGTPVFMMARPSRVSGISFLRKRFYKDLTWAMTSTPEPPPWHGNAIVIETKEEAEQAVEYLLANGLFSFDTETAGAMGDRYFQVICLAATSKADLNNAFVWSEEALKDPECLQPLQRLLESSKAPKNAHNLKFDIKACAYGLGLLDHNMMITFKGGAADTNLWTKAIDTEALSRLEYTDTHVGMGGHKHENKAVLAAARSRIKRARSTNELYLEGTNHPALDASRRLPELDEDAFAYGLIPRKILYRYCALDTIACARLEAKYRPVIERTPHLQFQNDVLFVPATDAIAQIETWGMSASVDAANMLGKVLRPIRDKALRAIRQHGCTINVGSNPQLVQYLYKDLGLPVTTLTKTNQPSTSADTLRKIQDKHPVIPHLLEFAKVDKLLSTYVDGLIPHIMEDGRIRARLNLDVVRSGRLSCSSPNLQTIPSRGSWAKMAKNIFNAPEGHLLLVLDYSQLEVRVAGILSGDEDLKQAYLSGIDVHRMTASKAFGVPIKEVTKAQRSAAKTVVFGVMYGKSVNSLAVDLGVTKARAQEIYDAVLGAYPALRKWLKDQIRYTQEHGVSWTYVAQPDGTLTKARCRQLWGIASPDGGIASKARNGAINSPIQGSASDYMLRSLCAIVDWIRDTGMPVRVTNTVHDSVILEVPEEYALEVAYEVRRIMESWPACGMPLVADCELGYSWGNVITLEALEMYATCLKNGLSGDDFLTTALGTPSVADEMGSDRSMDHAWLSKVDRLAKAIHI
jgi:DNA polymerase-1